MIEILNEFKDLGFIFNKNRKFSSMYVVNQARKALFGLYSKIRNLDLSIECQLKLFDNLVVPIWTYGCEGWGFRDFIRLNPIEQCKTVLKTATNNDSVAFSTVQLTITVGNRFHISSAV